MAFLADWCQPLDFITSPQKAHRQIPISNKKTDYKNHSAHVVTSLLPPVWHRKHPGATVTHANMKILKTSAAELSTNRSCPSVQMNPWTCGGPCQDKGPISKIILDVVWEHQQCPGSALSECLSSPSPLCSKSDVGTPKKVTTKAQAPCYHTKTQTPAERGPLFYKGHFVADMTTSHTKVRW